MKSLFIALALLAGTANAAELTAEQERMHVAELTELRAGSLNELLAQAATFQRKFTDDTGFEACGAIATDDAGQFGIVVTTNNAHMGCLNYHDRVPAGMHSTGLTIHTHGRDRTFRLNEADQLFVGIPRDKTARGYNREAVNHFSAGDYKGGAGYLATDDGVLFQNGQGTEARAF